MPERIPRCTILFCTLLLTGCSEFPCVDGQTQVETVGAIELNYDERARYTYWFEDGAQRVVFDREEVPLPARAAVVVHIPEQTDGELHGSVGWIADVRNGDDARANLMPMALARAAAHDAWAGDWTARWIETRAGLLAGDLGHRKRVEAQLAAVEEITADGREADAETPTLSEQDESMETQRAKRQPPTSPLQKELDEEGISLDAVKRDRALRVVGAQQPQPMDFGLSKDIEIHRVWLFVEDSCKACETAEKYLAKREIPFHIMRVSDPTNARTLRELVAKTNGKPVVPTAWTSPDMLAGFHSSTWDQHFD